MREGELLGLQWDDFDFERGMVELRRTVSLRRGERRLLIKHAQEWEDSHRGSSSPPALSLSGSQVHPSS
jgi:integrase